MPDERNAFDLSSLSAADMSIVNQNREQRLAKIDASGRPWPKGVRVQLNSGVEVKCDVRYDGTDSDGTRRFVVLAEIDWENYQPRVLWVDEYPRDVTLIFRIPGMPDEDAHKMAAFMETRPMKIVEVD